MNTLNLPEFTDSVIIPTKGEVRVMADGGEGPTLLERVEAYLTANRMAPSRFGQLAVRSPSLVQRMREGKTVRGVTRDAIEVVLQHARPRTIAEWKVGKYRAAVEEMLRLEQLERLRRRTCPIERAATYVRQRGWMVARETVFDNGAGWRVGTRTMTDEGLIERAKRMGWEQ